MRSFFWSPRACRSQKDSAASSGGRRQLNGDAGAYLWQFIGIAKIGLRYQRKYQFSMCWLLKNIKTQALFVIAPHVASCPKPKKQIYNRLQIRKQCNIVGKCSVSIIKKKLEEFQLPCRVSRWGSIISVRNRKCRMYVVGYDVDHESSIIVILVGSIV